jgi:hypothetical protein
MACQTNVQINAMQTQSADATTPSRHQKATFSSIGRGIGFTLLPASSARRLNN